MTFAEAINRRSAVWHTTFLWTDAYYELYSKTRMVFPEKGFTNDQPAPNIICRSLFLLENTVVPTEDGTIENADAFLDPDRF